MESGIQRGASPERTYPLIHFGAACVTGLHASGYMLSLGYEGFHIGVYYINGYIWQTTGLHAFRLPIGRKSTSSFQLQQ
ncbi:hypothetical protein L914_00234 [Phytophthora nicotianae]|uniref:Uncharacterized protein n=1 Tax=Phytophthora nicotianae TaxID=4792 RepID=W2P7D4_PHYNI|nr:hypothetical protein L914_00234 [Phytophthora nicotianae]